MVYLLSQLLKESSTRYGGEPAVCCAGCTLTYQQLDSFSGKIAATLRENGVETGDRVGIYMTKSVESIASIFGILKAGAVYVPIDWFIPNERLLFIANDCEMRAVVTSAEGAGKIASGKTADSYSIPVCIVMTPHAEITALVYAADTIVTRDTVEQQQSIEPVTHGIIDRDLAYILYTSGSTGAPKGVMLSHLNALAFVNMAIDFFGITSKDRIANHAPLHFDLSVFDIFCAIKAGACVVLLTEKEVVFPAAIVNAIKRNAITIWNSVPSALIQLVSRFPLDVNTLSSLRLVLFAGELFPSKYLRVLMEKLPHAAFYNMYGQTEANSSTWYKVERAPGPDDPPVPIGKAFPNYDIFALDSDGALVNEPGKKGELYVRGATVALGYWRNAEKTATQFVINPICSENIEIVYKTGDIVDLDKDHNYCYIGRKDEMIKSRGFRIEIGEIEAAFCKHPAVSDAAVVAVSDDEIGNRLVGFIVPVDGKTITPVDMHAFCRQLIPHYMIPEPIIICGVFPRTSTGKIDRQTLVQWFNEKQSSLTINS
ncbi:MAG TPA: amino acid adenylation domain-containing protein [Chitinispirillaceae bacterium]|nr:amino acid adenylation domain-containing protein [Chitinispirillaceae bacterium]